MAQNNTNSASFLDSHKGYCQNCEIEINTREHLDQHPDHEIDGLTTYSEHSEKELFVMAPNNGYCMDCRKDVNIRDHLNNPLTNDHDVKGFTVG